MLEGRIPLQGWKYPIWTSLEDKKMVNALMRAGVPKRLLKDESRHKEIKLFDFLAKRDVEVIGGYRFDSSVVSIAVSIMREKGTVGIKSYELLRLNIEKRRVKKMPEGYYRVKDWTFFQD